MKPFLLFAWLSLSAIALHAQPEAAVTNAAPAETASISTNSPSDPPPATNVVTEVRINSDGAVMLSETNYTVIYSGNVQADYGDAHLTCEQLTICAEKEAEAPDYILAERNVVLNHKDRHGKPIHATGDRATYSLETINGQTNQIITVTGNARVEMARANFTGETVTINLTTGEVRSNARQQTVIKIEGNLEDKLPFNTTRTNAP